MIYTNYIPPISLLPYIDRYWHCSSKGITDIDLFPLFAGTGLDLIIHFSSPFGSSGSTLETSHIMCPRQFIALSSDNKLDFLAIRFRSGAFRHFCPISFKELNNTFMPVSDIWGRVGDELWDTLRDEQSVIKRVELLNNFLLKQLANYKKPTVMLDSSISCIYNNYDSLSIYSLARDQKISLRHFERLFKEEFGISPKKFQTISRFQSTVKDLLLSSNTDCLQVALSNGYYDQSHFIKECRLLSGMSPLEVLSLKNKCEHFYFRKYDQALKNSLLKIP